MMKKKTMKYAVNGVLFAGLAAIGIAAFQIGTYHPEEDVVPEIVHMEAENSEPETKPEEPDALVDAGTSQVEAKMESSFDSTDTVTGLPDSISPESAGTTAAGSAVSESSAAALSAPALNFSEDTLMEWPVNGNILLDYSMDQTTYFSTLDQYKLSPAIAVYAAEDAPVMAAAAGTVFSIEEKAQTGTTVTMELGNGYQAVYGQLKDLTVEEGETVAKGQIIGYISSPTKYYCKEGSNLYFAMKKNGEPIDPITYLP